MYYQCVEDYFETFIQIYDDHFSRQYGFWRPYLEKVIYRYLDCGDLYNGLVQVETCEGLAAHFIIVLPAEAFLKSTFNISYI
jgi:hypothetical protein